MKCLRSTRQRPLYRSLLLSAPVVALTWPSLLYGQETPERTVRAVEIVGAGQVSEVYLRELLRVQEGDGFDAAALDEAVIRLLQTGQFISATYRLEEAGDGVRVTFELRTPPVITSIRFEGNVKFKEGRLKKQVTVKEGAPVDKFAIREGRDAIAAMYREEGYNDVVVSYDQERLDRSGELVYDIQEGKRVRIRKILFEGNAAFIPRQLRRQIDTKKAFWFLRAGAFDENRVESDVARLQRHYRDEGFLDARVGYGRELGADGSDMTLVFMIEEGTRYAVEAIEFRGNTVFSDRELLDRMVSRVWATVKRRQVEADARSVQARYGELGYIYARVRAIRVFSDAPGLVRITIQITEGDQFRVGQVMVRGNARTKDKVVRRALDLYPPDDLFDLTEARAAERRLRETRIFNSARVYPVGDAPDVRDVVIDVQEAPKAGDFMFGMGVTSNSGVVGHIVLNLQNFDLFDWPRSWSELFTPQSFFGGGQRLRLELQPGTELSRVRIDFTEPYLMDKPVRFDLSMYLFERGRDGYIERRGGMSVSFGKRFERGRLRGWRGELALRAEDVTIHDVDLFASREIRKDEGGNLMLSAKGTLVRDRTDNRFVPSEGDRLQVAYQQFGGDHAFGKVTAGYTWYKTLRKDLLDRKSVLKLRARGGVIVGDAPVFDRFYAGGTGSIRGFAFRGIGERDGIDDNNIGGDFLALLGAEYSFPLVGENVRGLLFVDSGTVDSEAWRAAIGVGVRFTLQLFGPVPLELGLAIPVSSDSDDDEQVFSFQIGALF